MIHVSYYCTTNLFHIHVQSQLISVIDKWREYVIHVLSQLISFNDKRPEYVSTCTCSLCQRDVYLLFQLFFGFGSVYVCFLCLPFLAAIYVRFLCLPFLAAKHGRCSG